MLLKIITKAKELKIDKVYVFSHEYPDGDAIGSSLALVEVFRSIGFTSKYVITKENRFYNKCWGINKKIYTSTLF